MGVFLHQRGSPLVRGLERRSLAAFLAWDCKRVGSDELAISMPCMALRAVFLEPRPAARLGLVPLQAASSRFAEPQGFHGVAAGKQRTKQRDCFERLATALLRCGEQDLNR